MVVHALRTDLVLTVGEACSRQTGGNVPQLRQPADGHSALPPVMKKTTASMRLTARSFFLLVFNLCVAPAVDSSAAAYGADCVGLRAVWAAVPGVCPGGTPASCGPVAQRPLYICIGPATAVCHWGACAGTTLTRRYASGRRNLLYDAPTLLLSR